MRVSKYLPLAPSVYLRAIDSTWPLKSFWSNACMWMFTFWPIWILPTSASSTSAATCIVERSATSIMTVPALFIVPVTTSSPSSALRRVITPSIGERIVV